jgi:hypothetical protein
MRFLFAGLTLFVSYAAYAQDLSALQRGQLLRIAMVGQGPMCEARLVRQTDDGILLHMLTTGMECGTRGQTVRILKDQVSEVRVRARLTTARTALRVLAGLGAVAGAGAIAAHVGGVEGAFFAIPAAPLAASGAWMLVPHRREAVLFITCPDRFHCFSEQAAAPSKNPSPPDEK